MRAQQRKGGKQWTEGQTIADTDSRCANKCQTCPDFRLVLAEKEKN